MKTLFTFLLHTLFVFQTLLLRAAAEEKESRTALIMGVGDYDGRFGLKALPGIGADLSKMKACLESVGFKVMLVENPSLSQAFKSIDEFGTALKDNKGIGLFYFSGHGGEYQGKNYLIPKGAQLTSKTDVTDQAINAQRILNRMEEAGNGTNILFLDCCRNELSKAASDSGMAAMSAKGTFIGFATASEKTAAASTSGSPYTTALTKHIPTSSISILDMHTRVTKDVEQMTDKEQTPFQYSGLSDVFYFSPNGAAPYVPPPVEKPKPDGGTIPAAKPQPPPEEDHSGIKSFFARWWDHQGSDEAAVWAADFTSPCDYEYGDSGRTSRSFITEDRRKLINRYSRRLYSLVDDPSYDVTGDTATMKVHFRYRYDGKKRASGSARVTLRLEKSDGDWRIASYRESVVPDGKVQDGGNDDQGDKIEDRGGDVPPGGRAALGPFVESWWKHQFSDSAATWAADFRSPCNYCYGEGRSSRKFILQDRQKLLNLYNQRVLRPLMQPEITLSDSGASATVRMSYAYAYSGVKNASGTATVNLSLSWDGSSWGITRYSEKTKRD